MKKQICLVMAAMMAAGMLAGCSGSAKETTAAATAVSYTHLDVYKRQELQYPLS